MKWLSEKTVRALNDKLVAAYGGVGAAVRDANLLGSALARPQNLLAYAEEEPSVCALAASLVVGLIQNHPFLDGNKRTALMACFTFLRHNGWALTAPEGLAVEAMVRVATNELDEVALAQWLTDHCVKL